MAGSGEVPDLIGQDWSMMWRENVLASAMGTATAPSHSVTSTGPQNAAISNPSRPSPFAYRPIADVKRLPASDMFLFGFAPENEDFRMAVCSLCSRFVLLEALHHHMVRHHGLPPPPITPVIMTTTDEQQTLKPPIKPKSPPEEQLDPTVALLPQIKSSDSKRSKKKKKRQEKSRDKTQKIFDPNRHCGVENDLGKPCTRSILCKVHLVALKRAVPHRRLPYDTLVKLLKSNAAETQSVMVSTRSIVEEPPAKRIKPEVVEDVVVSEVDEGKAYVVDALIEKRLMTDHSVSSGGPKVAPILRWTLSVKLPAPNTVSTMDSKLTGAAPPLEDITWHAVHPKPLATNTFGCRLVGGLLTKNKRLEARRKEVQAVWVGKHQSNPLSNAASAAALSNAVSMQTQQTTASAASFKRRRSRPGPTTSEPVHMLAVRTSSNMPPQYVMAQLSK